MKKVFLFIFAALLFAGCEFSHKGSIKSKYSYKGYDGRFEHSASMFNGSWYHVLQDNDTGREYLVVYGNSGAAIIELTK